MMTTQTVAPTKQRRGRDQRKGRDPASDSTNPIAPPPKLRRRPLLWAIGIALIALGGLGAAYVTTTVGDTSSVLALRADVNRGETIEASDLVAAQIPNDPALEPVPEADRERVVGQKAARDLNIGSLLTSDAFAGQIIPGPGETLVGVALTPAQMPATGIRPGDRVRIVNTPREQENLPAKRGVELAATVVSLRSVPDQAMSVVDVTVSKANASRLAALVATGRVGLVVDGVGQR